MREAAARPLDRNRIAVGGHVGRRNLHRGRTRVRYRTRRERWIRSGPGRTKAPGLRISYHRTPVWLPAFTEWLATSDSWSPRALSSAFRWTSSPGMTSWPTSKLWAGPATWRIWGRIEQLRSRRNRLSRFGPPSLSEGCLLPAVSRPADK